MSFEPKIVGFLCNGALMPALTLPVFYERSLP